MDSEVDREHQAIAGTHNYEAEEKVFKKARSDVRKLFYIQAFGQVLSLGGLLAVQMMQTSLNVEGRVGRYTGREGDYYVLNFGLYSVVYARNATHIVHER